MVLVATYLMLLSFMLLYAQYVVWKAPSVVPIRSEIRDVSQRGARRGVESGGV